MKKVLIIYPHGYSTNPKRYYNRLESLIKDRLCNLGCEVMSTSSNRKIMSWPAVQECNTIIFLARSQKDDATSIKRQHPEKNIILLVGKVFFGDIIDGIVPISKNDEEMLGDISFFFTGIKPTNQFLKEISGITETEITFPRASSLGKNEVYDQMSFEEAQIITMLLVLRERLLLFYEEARNANEEKHYDFQDMKNGYIEPQVKIMILLSMLWSKIQLRLNIFEIETVFCFDDKDIIKPNGDDRPGDLIISMNPDQGIKQFCGPEFGVPTFLKGGAP